jgi:tetratricopeptide (TPR) repeat protein
MENALESLGTGELDEHLATVEGQLGRFLTLAGRHDDALPHLERALGNAELLRLPEVFAQALISKSVSLNYKSRLEETRILLEGAIAYADGHELSSAAVRAMNNLAVVFESRDRYADALDLTHRGIEQARRVGDRGWERQLLLGSLTSYVFLGRWDEATAIAEAAAADVFDDVQVQAQLFLTMIEVPCHRGDVITARELLDRHVGNSASDDVQGLSGVALYRGMVLRLEGKLEEAAEQIRIAVSFRNELGAMFLTVKLAFAEALELAFELRDLAWADELVTTIESMRPGERPPFLDAHAARGRAKLNGDERGLAGAVTRFRELQMPWWIAVTQLERGELLREAGRADEADPLFAEAAEIFEQLSATPWLERAQTAVLPA